MSVSESTLTTIGNDLRQKLMQTVTKWQTANEATLNRLSIEDQCEQLIDALSYVQQTVVLNHHQRATSRNHARRSSVNGNGQGQDDFGFSNEEGNLEAAFATAGESQQ